MPELSSTQAAEVIGVTSQTIRRYVDRGLLPARQVGVKGLVKVDVGDLRKFAAKYDYRFDADLANHLAE